MQTTSLQRLLYSLVAICCLAFPLYMQFVQYLRVPALPAPEQAMLDALRGRAESPIDGLVAELESDSPAWSSFVRRTHGVVSKWPVEPGRAGGTDRVAVLLFQSTGLQDVQLHEYVVRSNMRRLGPRWALQVIYGAEEAREKLDAALGAPAAVLWTPMHLEGERRISISYEEMERFRLSMDLWGSIPETFEHVLIFEADSMALRGRGCVDRFLRYDYVGSPWNPALGLPSTGGNGGFSLRRRSVTVRAIQAWLRRTPEERKAELWAARGEDVLMCRLLERAGASFPNQSTAMQFAVETIFYPAPCAFHKPWHEFSNEEVELLLESADMD